MQMKVVNILEPYSTWQTFVDKSSKLIKTQIVARSLSILFKINFLEIIPIRKTKMINNKSKRIKPKKNQKLLYC